MDNKVHETVVKDWEERRGEEEEKAIVGWTSVDKTTDLPGFPALGWSGEEGWLEQDGKVCDKRNSSDFIVPTQHTSRNMSFEAWSNAETQDCLFWE